jgi:hypothetical protein
MLQGTTLSTHNNFRQKELVGVEAEVTNNKQTS